MAQTQKGNTRKGVSGFGYSFLIQGTTQIINFAVSVILARVLMPEEFGLVGMIMIFISLSKTLIDGGFISSLIRTHDVDEEDYSTVFFINLGVSVILYALLFVCAPYISEFYEEPILLNIIRVFAIVLIINALSIVQSTKLNKALDFKTQFKLIVPALVISAVTSIWMAYNGYGVWSLIWKEVIFTTIGAVLLWYHGKWVPTWTFNVQKFTYHFNFGYKLALTQIFNTLFDNLYRFIIGAYYSAAQLGYFTRARTFEQLPSQFFINAFNRVAYPMLAKVSNDEVKLKSVYSKLMQMAVFLIAPILIYIGVIAEPLFRWLLTEKWLPAVPYFQLLLLSGLFFPLQKYNLNICSIKGRTDIVLKISVFQNLLTLAGGLLAIWFGIFGLLYSLVFVSITVTMVTAYMSGALIGYSIGNQLKDLFPVFAISITAGVVTYFADNYMLSGQKDLVRIILLGVVYGVVYIAAAMLLKIEAFAFAKKTILKQK